MGGKKGYVNPLQLNIFGNNCKYDSQATLYGGDGKTTIATNTGDELCGNLSVDASKNVTGLYELGNETKVKRYQK